MYLALGVVFTIIFLNSIMIIIGIILKENLFTCT